MSKSAPQLGRTYTRYQAWPAGSRPYCRWDTEDEDAARERVLGQLLAANLSHAINAFAAVDGLDGHQDLRTSLKMDPTADRLRADLVELDSGLATRRLQLADCTTPLENVVERNWRGCRCKGRSLSSCDARTFPLNSTRLLWSLLDQQARRRFLWLLVLTTVSGFVEILSVGLVIPFVAVASGSLPYGKAHLITRGLIGFVHSLGVPEQLTTAALGLVFLIGVITANIYLCCYQYYAARVVNLQKCDFSLRIIRNLLGHPLQWLDQRNSSDLTKVALTDVAHACLLINAVTQVAAIFTRCCVVYAFFLLTQARLAIFMAIALVVLQQVVFKFVQKLVVGAGELAQRTQAQMFRAASELIGGAREVRATSTELKFYQKFLFAAEAAVQPQVIRIIPAYLTRAGLETATVSLVIALLVYFNSKDGDLANGLPLLSSYAVAGIRLLPALQQSLSYFLEIRFNAPSLEEVARLLLDIPANPDFNNSPRPLTLTRQLELREIGYSYSPDHKVLNAISLQIKKNTRVAFVGETGAGKSTLVDIILALRQPQEGSLWVDDVQINELNGRSWRLDIGYVPQAIYLIDASISENVAFGIPPAEIDFQKLVSACEAASINGFIQGLPQTYETLVGERGVRLSGGQCQRIGIARALYHNPEVVIFDEATSSLDSQTESTVLEALDRLKGEKTLVVIAHRLNTVWDFDQIFVLNRGSLIAQGTSAELLKSCPAFQRLCQHQLNLGSSPQPCNFQNGL